MARPKQPFILMILDGFGYRESSEFNAISAAKMPVWNHLWKTSPRLLISTSGLDVGLPDEQMGNSEVGHMNMGAGRVVYQDLTRIDLCLKDGSFFKNEMLLETCRAVKARHAALHIFGLLSKGGVHSHERHIQAALQLAKQEGVGTVFLHAFLDGRDTPPQCALESIQFFERCFQEEGLGRFATLMGRYYAMDRDQRFERTQAAYDCITGVQAYRSASSAASALSMAYEAGETDEFVKPSFIVPKGEKRVQINSGDGILFMNFRADRARQLTHAFVDEEYSHFPRLRFEGLNFTTLTQYEKGLPVQVAYPPQVLHHTLGAWLSDQGKTQLRSAETEKYAHVTFFFNGGVEAPYPGEDRLLVPSPRVATYDLQPEMSALPLTDRLVTAILSGQYDFIVCNYANPDMLGHTGIFGAAVRALEVIDQCILRVEAAVQKVGGQMLITADHGNVECMVDPETHEPHTAHTQMPVPCVYVGPKNLRPVIQQGILADLAPTILSLMNCPKPPEMTGKVLFLEF